MTVNSGGLHRVDTFHESPPRSILIMKGDRCLRRHRSGRPFPRSDRGAHGRVRSIARSPLALKICFRTLDLSTFKSRNIPDATIPGERFIQSGCSARARSCRYTYVKSFELDCIWAIPACGPALMTSSCRSQGALWGADGNEWVQGGRLAQCFSKTAGIALLLL